MAWVYAPHSGGVKIPEKTKGITENKILDYAKEHYAGTFIRLGIRFRNQFCYIDAYLEPHTPDDLSDSEKRDIEKRRNTPMKLCRLRHFSEDKWSVAFYSYGNMKYEPSVFDNGTFEGTAEEGFEVGAMYLRNQ